MQQVPTILVYGMTAFNSFTGKLHNHFKKLVICIYATAKARVRVRDLSLNLSAAATLN
jgi:hypothetical protein